MTHFQRPKQFGLWSSPLTAAEVAHTKKFTDVAWEADGQALVWREERGEVALLVCQSDPCDAPLELTPDINVRARVGYGGGDFSVGSDTIFLVSESGLYRQRLAGGAERLVPACANFASPVVSPDGKYLACVASWEEKDCLVLVSTSGLNWPVQLDSSAGFYMQPCWHPDGNTLAWIGWDAPNMPWDGTALYLAEMDVSRGTPQPKSIRIVAGDPTGDTAIFQPSFSPGGGFLAYVSDQMGWSNIHLLDLHTASTRILVQEEAEHAPPAWTQGLRTYDWSPDGKALFYIRSKNGLQTVLRQAVHAKRSVRIAGELSEYSAFRQIAVSPRTGELALIASSPCLPPRVITCNEQGQVRVRCRSGPETITPEYCSRPRSLHWKEGADGADCFGLYYAPLNPAFRDDGAPPAVVRVHGGPTGQYVAEYRFETQFFTSRGYAVLELNYRGSSGYGRDFLQLLHGNWGVRDVEDAYEAGRFLIRKKLADPRRLVIMGASAGGYTVLRTMISYPGFFRAGVCLYGVSNLLALARDTHRFERHYVTKLIGKLPEETDKYRRLSPLFSADRIKDPLALFHGEDDKIVPKAQSDRIAFNLALHGVPHLYRVYPGEGHGWRKPETITDFYQQLEAFLLDNVIFPA
jgi:dipeptidyl aminopeptidase/acylaminoacyl peptidase